jgi:hypothetical protein
MFLEVAKAFKAEHADNTNDGCRVGVQALGHRTDAQKHKAARLFEHGPKNLLPLGG